MTASPLDDAFAHHAWATERLIEACRKLTPEQLRAPCLGTYGSIIATLRHLVASDRWYLSFFPSGATLAALDEDADTSLAELRLAVATNASAWAALLAAGIDPDEDVVERDLEGEFHAPVGIRLAQVIHHGSDHRSQVCTALTSLGIEPPEIDVWAFAEAAGRTRAVPLSPS